VKELEKQKALEVWERKLNSIIKGEKGKVAKAYWNRQERG